LLREKKESWNDGIVEWWNKGKRPIKDGIKRGSGFSFAVGFINTPLLLYSNTPFS
jgi:hypothetical protein